VERLFLETREQFGGVDLVVEAPGRMSALVRGAAGRHLRPGGTLVSFAGGGLTETPVDVGRFVAWLTAHPSAEVIVLPVSDAERAKRFYGDLGWRLDDDLVVEESFRLVRMTPPGSTASVIFGVGVTPAVPGTAAGLALPAPDIVPLDDPDGNTWLSGATRTRLPGR